MKLELFLSIPITVYLSCMNFYPLFCCWKGTFPMAQGASQILSLRVLNCPRTHKITEVYLMIWTFFIVTTPQSAKIWSIQFLSLLNPFCSSTKRLWVSQRSVSQLPRLEQKALSAIDCSGNDTFVCWFKKGFRQCENRDLLWHKLRHFYGTEDKFLAILQDMYEEVLVIVNRKLSDRFQAEVPPECSTQMVCPKKTQVVHFHKKRKPRSLHNLSCDPHLPTLRSISILVFHQRNTLTSPSRLTMLLFPQRKHWEP